MSVRTVLALALLLTIHASSDGQLDQEFQLLQQLSGIKQNLAFFKNLTSAPKASERDQVELRKCICRCWDRGTEPFAVLVAHNRTCFCTSDVRTLRIGPNGNASCNSSSHATCLVASITEKKARGICPKVSNSTGSALTYQPTSLPKKAQTSTINKTTKTTQTPMTTHVPRITQAPKTTKVQKTTHEPRITQVRSTTQVPRKTQVPKTAQVQGTTQAPRKTQEPTTTQAPRTTQAPKTDLVQGTTQAPRKTQEPTTTQAPRTTPAPKTGLVQGTTQAPRKAQEPTTTQAPRTTQGPKTAQVQGTTRTPRKTQEPTTTEAPRTTPVPKTDLVQGTAQAPRTTQEPTTTEAPRTTQAPKTEQVQGTTRTSRTTSAPKEAESPQASSNQTIAPKTKETFRPDSVANKEPVTAPTTGASLPVSVTPRKDSNVSSQSVDVSPSKDSTAAGIPKHPLLNSQKSGTSETKPPKDSIRQRKPAFLSGDSSARNTKTSQTPREQRAPESLSKLGFQAAKKISKQAHKTAETGSKAPKEKPTPLHAVSLLEKRLAKKNINLIAEEKPSPKEVLKIAAESVDLEVGKGQVPKSFQLKSIVSQIPEV